MAENDDQWLWESDDEPSDSPMQYEQSVVQASTPVASAEVVKAVALHLAGKTDEALAELKRGLEKNLQPAEVHSAMGQMLFEKRRFQEAADSYAKLVGVEPSHKTGHYNLGVCLERLGKLQEAAQAFQRALEIDGARSQARLGLAI